ncbi:MAG: hypothetical protein CMH56_13735 [Myxococcales bacterium]|nr:hypothetical protein [Myxococcales bacterium]|tara:strand:- start:925 stop:1785 length:861 start_codon:yes stop_codon:yes gene_type:complete
MFQTEIAIFCRNEAKHLNDMVHHVVEQVSHMGASFHPVKLHILENGSDDNSADVAKELEAQRFPFSLQAHTHLPPGKAKTWNHFLELATAPYLIFLDADVQLASGALAQLRQRLQDNDDLHCAGAAPRLSPDFTPENFWQSVFAVPYDALPPAASLAGGAYGAKKAALSPMPEDVINEDLFLSLRHQGHFQCYEDIHLFVTPPSSLNAFIAQRTRILRADMAEQKRHPNQNIAQHRRGGWQSLKLYLKAAGPLKTLFFLWARQQAQRKAQRSVPTGSGWDPATRDG